MHILLFTNLAALGIEAKVFCILGNILPLSSAPKLIFSPPFALTQGLTDLLVQAGLAFTVLLPQLLMELGFQAHTIGLAGNFV